MKLTHQQHKGDVIGRKTINLINSSFCCQLLVATFSEKQLMCRCSTDMETSVTIMYGADSVAPCCSG
jgi:hypothetical protein